MLRPAAAGLSCEKYLDHCITLAEQPSAAQRQLDILAQTNDPREIVRQLTDAARVTATAEPSRRPLSQAK